MTPNQKNATSTYDVPVKCRGQKVGEVFYLIREQFHTHFIETIIITVSIGVIIVSLFVLAIMRLDRRRLGQDSKAHSVVKFGPDNTTTTPWHDRIASRERDLEKWREEHKAQL
jgi:hypothetical protein